MTHSNHPTILITGATGSIGSVLVKQLADQQIPFRALVRSLDQASVLNEIESAEIVIGDFKDDTSLISALSGIEKVFLLTNSSAEAERLQCNFVDIAVSTGVKHIVKLSQFAADLNSPVRFLRYHAIVEEKIKSTGLQYSFLRPNLFMQGLLGFADTIKSQQMFFATAGNAKISLVDTRDIATVALAALTTTEDESQIYNITGPEAMSHDEIAQVLSEVLQRDIKYINISDKEMHAALLQIGFPEWQTAGLIEDYAHYARGEAAMVADTVQNLNGKAPRRFVDFVKDYKSAFE